MTLKELNRCRALQTEIRDLEGRLQREADGGVRELLSLRKRQSEEAMSRIHRYIAECPDPLIRSILINRFIDGLSWRAAAHRVGNGSEDSCRVMVSRYIKSEE